MKISKEILLETVRRDPYDYQIFRDDEVISIRFLDRSGNRYLYEGKKYLQSDLEIIRASFSKEYKWDIYLSYSEIISNMKIHQRDIKIEKLLK